MYVQHVQHTIVRNLRSTARNYSRAGAFNPNSPPSSSASHAHTLIAAQQSGTFIFSFIHRICFCMQICVCVCAYFLLYALSLSSLAISRRPPIYNGVLLPSFPLLATQNSPVDELKSANAQICESLCVCMWNFLFLQRT